MKKEMILSIEEKNGKLILEANHGSKWVFPGNLSRDIAIASLVYGTLLNANEKTSCFSSHYKITMEVQILDEKGRGVAP